MHFLRGLTSVIRIFKKIDFQAQTLVTTWSPTMKLIFLSLIVVTLAMPPDKLKAGNLVNFCFKICNTYIHIYIYILLFCAQN